MINKDNALKLGAGVLAVALGFGLGGVMVEPTEVIKEVKVNVLIPTPGPIEYVNVTKLVDKEVIVESPLNIELAEEVQEQDALIQAVCDRLLFDDVRDCQKEVKAEDSALKIAIAEIEDEFADSLDDFDFGDEDDMKLIKVYDDFEDISVEKSRYSREEYEFEIKVKIDNDDDKEYYIFTVEVEDDKAEIIDVKEE